MRVRALGLAAAASLLLTGVAAAAPPKITEPFTRLSCPAKAKTTLDQEACAEQRVLSSDAAINATAAKIYVLLHGTARTDFVRSEKNWLAYRRGSCSAEASKVKGGSLEPVDYAECEIARNETHDQELIAMQLILTTG